MYHASCAFLCRRCSTTTWNCLILRFVEGVKATQWFSTEKNCGYSLLEVDSSKIHHYFMNWVTWNKHGAMNFETTWIHFLRDVLFSLPSSSCFFKLPVTIVKPIYNEAQGTGKICSLSWGFVISRVFPLYFTINGEKNIVRYTEDFVIWGFVKTWYDLGTEDHVQLLCRLIIF